jgi:hypothetical protein
MVVGSHTSDPSVWAQTIRHGFLEFLKKSAAKKLKGYQQNPEDQGV